MQRSFRKVTALVTLCLLFGGVGLAPEVANTTGSPVVKAATKYTKYIKTETAKVYSATGSAATTDTVVKTLKRNKKVTQYGKAKNGWAKISYASGRTGYVESSKLAKKRADLLKVANADYKRIKAAVKGDNYWAWNNVRKPEKVLITDISSKKIVYHSGSISNFYYYIVYRGIERNGHLEYEIEIERFDDPVLEKKGITSARVIKYIKEYEKKT